jgi:hypothetical protein
MFDRHDEKARQIVSEFCKRYNVSHKFFSIGKDNCGNEGGLMPEPKVWLMAEIAKALKEVEKK